MLHPIVARPGLGKFVALALSSLLTAIAFAQQLPPGPLRQRKQDEDDRQARVAKLISQMTLEEKVSQMRNHAAAIPRLGIPAYDYWNEGLHGSARSGYSTLFPQAIGLAASWDTSLLHEVATAISTEARAKHSEAVRHGNFDIYYGLTIWSPNINIFRDPRWGRGQETYGEDPFLTARLGVAFVSGLQGDDLHYLRTVATPKHFAVHSGPESTRHSANVDPSPRDLEETYLPAFRATITEAHAQSLMCAYNAVNGEPACANSFLLQGIARKAWGFNGFVTSDCGAVADIAEGHKYAKDLERAAVDALMAGTDTSCGTEFDTLTQAVHDGLIQKSDLDTAVKRLFMARFRLGMFDPPAQVAYESTPFTEVDSPAHAQLALQAARESMVLLKNDGTLPLKSTVKTVAVIGPNAVSLAALEGNYNAIALHPVNPLDGLRTALAGRARVLYAQGSPYVAPLPLVVPETVLHTGNQNGLRGEYFANTNFAGKPSLIRTDKSIEFDWYSASPAEGIPAKAFSVRWTGTFTAPAAGDFTLSVGQQHCHACKPTDSSAIYLDGKLLVEQKPFTTAEDSSEHTATVHLADTKPHNLRIEYVHGAPEMNALVSFKWLPPAAALEAEAVKAAQLSDVVVAFVGLSPNLEGEEMPVKVEGFSGGDRTDIKLPEVQLQMLEAVAATGKPLIVVMLNGSALAVNWAKDHAAAILEAWYPGQAGGTAIADTLLGVNNPAGRLPVTFYRSIDDLPPFDDYSMKARTYRYATAKPLFAFGDGLSYTSFAYTKANLSKPKIVAGESLDLKVHVENTGRVAGDEVVEVYLAALDAKDAPVHSLVGFQRVHLAAHEGADVSIAIDPRKLSQVDAAGHRAVLPGHYLLSVAGHQPDSTTATLALDITGRSALPQ
jgi:beta-glucosidase